MTGLKEGWLHGEKYHSTVGLIDMPMGGYENIECYEK